MALTSWRGQRSATEEKSTGITIFCQKQDCSQQYKVCVKLITTFRRLGLIAQVDLSPMNSSNAILNTFIIFVSTTSCNNEFHNLCPAWKTSLLCLNLMTVPCSNSPYICNFIYCTYLKSSFLRDPFQTLFIFFFPEGRPWSGWILHLNQLHSLQSIRAIPIENSSLSRGEGSLPSVCWQHTS